MNRLRNLTKTPQVSSTSVVGAGVATKLAAPQLNPRVSAPESGDLARARDLECIFARRLGSEAPSPPVTLTAGLTVGGWRLARPGGVLVEWQSYTGVWLEVRSPERP